MTTLRRIEWVLAIFVTCAVVSLHVVFLEHAGGLWRDEVNTVVLATLPSLSELFRWLDFDSFPILWFLIIRTWHGLGLGSDISLRFLGCAIGVCLIGALWLNARAFRFTFPFFSLILLGFNSSVIRWGDSLRAYGFGMCVIILCFVTTWLVTQNPTRRNIVCATMVAILSVQTLYFSSLLLFAASMGAVAVCARHRWWQRIGLLLGIGSVAAISMLVYIPVFKHATTWNELFRHDRLGAAWYWHKFADAASPDGRIAIWIWLGGFAAVFALGVVSLLPKTVVTMTEEQRDIACFSFVALLIGVGIYYLFLFRLRYVTEPWYYLAFMAFFAAATDASLSVAANGLSRRVIRVAVVIVLLAIMFKPALRASRIRMTNADLVAAQLTREAEKDDFIVLHLWDGVSFNRYYRGAARWATIPPISDHRFHRADLVIPYMTKTNQEIALDPLFEQMGRTLKGGHRIWVVGGLELPGKGEGAGILAPAPFSPYGWQLGAYDHSWSIQVRAFLERHVIHGRLLPPSTPQPVNHYENLLPVGVFWDWN